MATTAPLTLVQQNPQEKRRQALATAMMGNALQYRPMRTGWEALGSLANAYVGGKMGQAADTSYQDRQTSARDTLARALSAREQAPAPWAPGQEDAAFTAIMGETPATSDLHAQLELNKMLAENKAITSTPNYIKIPWSGSPTGMAYADKRQPNIPVAPAPPGSQGLQVDFNPEGGISGLSFGGQGMGIGPAGDVSNPTPRTVGTVQDKAFSTNEGYERMYRISQLYQPQYQEIGTRLGMGWSELKDKFGGLDATDKRQLYEYSRFKKSSVNHLNLYFNEISGAAVSPEEAVRLTNGLPNAGTGIWDGDSPTVFEAGLDEAMRGARMANLRYNVWMKVGDQGGNPWDIPFSDVGTWLRNMGEGGKGMLNEYAAEVERQLAPRYSDPEKLREAVKATVKQDLMFTL